VFIIVVKGITSFTIDIAFNILPYSFTKSSLSFILVIIKVLDSYVPLVFK
jgi:hypothetical protein